MTERTIKIMVENADQPLIEKFQNYTLACQFIPFIFCDYRREKGRARNFTYFLERS